MIKPEVVILCGPAGSGKTTYADKLVTEGYEKFSIDESMVAQYGLAGLDFPVENYRTYELDVLADHKSRIAGLLAVGSSVVLDYGFPTRRERDEYKAIAEQLGGKWRLLYFRVPLNILWQRIEARNLRSDANAQPISHALLRDLVRRFEIPINEGEEVIENY